MAVNGIYTMNRSSAENTAQYNFNRFTNNVMMDNMDRMNDTQKFISEELRDRLKDKNKNDDDGINFNLYTKEDEDNPENKNKAEDRSQHHHVILNPGSSMLKAPGRTSSPAECQTCANRKYQDGSNENDVSFKTPTHISQSIAASVILGHEHEHVANAYEKEHNSNNLDHNHTHAHVDSASVHLKTDICPECGRVYFSGGVTNTVISYIDDEQYEKKSYKPYILVPSNYKDKLNNDESLQSLLNSTGAEIKYFEDVNNDNNKGETNIYVPLTLKDKLTREEYIQFIEETTNLKLRFYDSPADEEKNKQRYQPYEIFGDYNNNYNYRYNQGVNLDMNY